MDTIFPRGQQESSYTCNWKRKNYPILRSCIKANLAWKEQDIARNNPTNWQELLGIFNKHCLRYWKSSQRKRNGKISTITDTMQMKWQSLLDGELKPIINAAHKKGKTTTGVVLRNSAELLLEFWINHFNFDDPFCVDASPQNIKRDETRKSYH